MFDLIYIIWTGDSANVSRVSSSSPGVGLNTAREGDLSSPASWKMDLARRTSWIDTWTFDLLACETIPIALMLSPPMRHLLACGDVKATGILEVTSEE